MIVMVKLTNDRKGWTKNREEEEEKLSEWQKVEN